MTEGWDRGEGGDGIGREGADGIGREGGDGIGREGGGGIGGEGGHGIGGEGHGIGGEEHGIGWEGVVHSYQSVVGVTGTGYYLINFFLLVLLTLVLSCPLSLFF